MNDTMAMSSFLRQIEVESGDQVVQAIFGDWLEEHGFDRWEAFGSPLPLKPFDAFMLLEDECGSGSGRGRGLGIGSGSGRGGGSGSSSGLGSGSGRGRGLGIGSGSGRGGGSGSSRGIGSGSGIGRDSGTRVNHMEIGKAYLVHSGDWHTFVGRCVAMISPVVYALESASKISDTNAGDNWNLLASGDNAARKKATYIHMTTRVIIPLTVAAFEWVGKTPQEDGLGT